MAFGFIKKVFSFGKKEVVEAKVDETAPLPPLTFDALEALKPAAEQEVPDFLKREEQVEAAPAAELEQAPEAEKAEPAAPAEAKAPEAEQAEVVAEPEAPVEDQAAEPHVEIDRPVVVEPAPVEEIVAARPVEPEPEPAPEESVAAQVEPEQVEAIAEPEPVAVEAVEPELKVELKAEPEVEAVAEAETASAEAEEQFVAEPEQPAPEKQPEALQVEEASAREVEQLEPTLAPPSPRERGEGKGEGQHLLPEAEAPIEPSTSDAGTAPHPLPDLLPASGEKEAVASPVAQTEPAARSATGKVTVAKKVEQKAEAEKAPEPAPKRSWFQRMREGLSRSSRELTGNIAGVFTKRKLDDETLQDLEDVLIRADLGVETALRVTDSLAASRYGKDVSDTEVRAVMAAEVEKVLGPVAKPLELDLSHKPHVILVVGVNGTGKTTTIGKLAAKLTDGGLSVMLAAGDTFRAAAIEQLKIWGERTKSPVIATKLGADAAGLAYDAFEKAKEAGSDVLIIDTAGRLQNKTELMAELEKIVRVLGKLDPEAPHTVLQTVDATTGQNALNQVEIFRNVAGVNGLVMTKLDGTARGGILVAIAAKHKLPVYFIGVGEQVDDLEPFSAGDFAQAIAGVA